MGGLHTKYFLQIFNQMLKSTKKSRKAETSNFCIGAHLHYIHMLNKESVKKVKGGRSYGVHKVGTV